MAEETSGKAKHVGGKIKEGVGELLGDTEMERKGELQQVEGRAQQDEERAEDAAAEARARKNTAKLARDD